jgi:hypothetical protein
MSPLWMDPALSGLDTCAVIGVWAAAGAGAIAAIAAINAAARMKPLGRLVKRRAMREPARFANGDEELPL